LDRQTKKNITSLISSFPSGKERGKTHPLACVSIEKEKYAGEEKTGGRRKLFVSVHFSGKKIRPFNEFAASSGGGERLTSAGKKKKRGKRLSICAEDGEKKKTGRLSSPIKRSNLGGGGNKAVSVKEKNGFKSVGNPGKRGKIAF